MIIRCKTDITKKSYVSILDEIRELGLEADILRERDGSNPPVIGLKGDCSHINPDDFMKFEGVESVQRITVRYKLASRSYNATDTVVRVSDVLIGGNNLPVIMAGPCAVEARDQLLRIAEEVKQSGASILRGGAWKPRTFARTFEGLKEDALRFLKEASRNTGMPVVTEVMSADLIDLVAEYADILQVGARNMQNFKLLDRIGKQQKPVLLKRGVSATLDEFLGAADRIMEGGNTNVMLCLRGVRTFDYSQRFPADLYAIPDLKLKTHLPIIFDPSHSAGKRNLVGSIARMALAGGVDGLIIESHYSPCEAKCDGAQMITPQDLSSINDYLKQIHDINRKMSQV